MPDRTPADVRFASLECRAVYKEPIIRRWSERSEITEELFRAFREWNVSLEQVSDTSLVANLNQAQITFQLLQNRFVFRVGIGGAVLTVWNPNWTEQDTIEKVASAGLKTVRTAGRLEFDRYEITLDMHVTPSGGNIAAITRPFLSSAMSSPPNDTFTGYGFILHKNESFWYIDPSAAYSESLFLRLFMRFSPEKSVSEMTTAIRGEEVALLAMIGLSVAGIS